MINRLWYDWTTPANADTFELMLRTDILPEISARKLPGYQGAQVMRRDTPDESEFVTMLSFDSFEDIRSFAGEKLEVALVPESVQDILLRYGSVAYHYEVKADLAT